MTNTRSVIYLLLTHVSIISLLFSMQEVEAKEPLRPNIVVITIDALRADHLSCYGYQRHTSPNIDKIAQVGVLFTQAIAQSSHTPPSMCTILTSTLPRRHLVKKWGCFINSKLITFPSVLKSNGYKTIFISSHPTILKGIHGFARDFDVSCEERYTAQDVSNKAAALVEECIKKPFFLWVHYMDVHDYSPSDQHRTLYTNDTLFNKQKKLPIVEEFNHTQYGYKGIPRNLACKYGKMNNPDYYISQYDSAIFTVDEQIGALLKKLEGHSVNSGMLVIITSDHGEMFGEHDYYFSHGAFLYDSLLKVPLIIAYKDMLPKQRVIIDEPINAGLDVAPTVLDILKIEEAKTMQGVSLLSMILEGKHYPFLYVLSDEASITDCIRTNEWKLIRYCCTAKNKKNEFYNIKKDPGELINLYSQDSDKDKKAAFQFLNTRLNQYVQEGILRNRSEVVIDEATKKDLRSLGYLQ